MAGQVRLASPAGLFSQSLVEPFYVGEQECDCTCWWASHSTVMSSLFHLWGHYSSGAFFGPSVHPSV